eukprot:20418-Heterococcus_DN1.PRE.1
MHTTRSARAALCLLAHALSRCFKTAAAHVAIYCLKAVVTASLIEAGAEIIRGDDTTAAAGTATVTEPLVDTSSAMLTDEELTSQHALAEGLQAHTVHNSTTVSCSSSSYGNSVTAADATDASNVDTGNHSAVINSVIIPMASWQQHRYQQCGFCVFLRNGLKLLAGVLLLGQRLFKVTRPNIFWDCSIAHTQASASRKALGCSETRRKLFSACDPRSKQAGAARQRALFSTAYDSQTIYSALQQGLPAEQQAATTASCSNGASRDCLAASLHSPAAAMELLPAVQAAAQQAVAAAALTVQYVVLAAKVGMFLTLAFLLHAAVATASANTTLSQVRC